MSLPANKRIAFVDAAKTICIFLMIIGHFTANEILLTYIYSFHMPAFFIISGYLYKPHSWKGTIQAFAIPFIFLSLINIIIQLVIGELSFHELCSINILSRFIHYRYGLGHGFFMGDWFLWALIGLRFLFGDIDQLKILRKYYIPIAVICVIYMTFENNLLSIDTLFRGYYIGLMIPSLVFFCTGFYLKDIQWTPKTNHTIYLIPLTLLFFTLPLLNGHCSINSNEFGNSYLLFVANAIISTILLFVICERLPSSKYIMTISKGTLVILGIHMPIIHILQIIFPRVLSFLFPVITLVMCYYIILLCEKYFPKLLGKG